MNALSWVGVVLMAFGAFWAFMMFLSKTWFPPRTRGPAPRGAPKANPVAEILKAIADMFRAAAELLKLDYGAPSLIFLGGLIVLIIGQVS
jgi:hypothetical protein